MMDTMEEETMAAKVERFMAVWVEVVLIVKRTEKADKETVLIDMAVIIK